MASLTSPNVVFVLGGPGTGKGTQCLRIKEHFGYHHLSAGDLLREERSRPGSEHGELIESYIREGKIVPIEITLQLIEKAMRKLGWEGGRFLIDGFPRSFENLSGWNAAFEGKVNIQFCIFFDCSDQVMEARLLERSKTSGRADDNIDSIRKRFRVFKEESMPVVQTLESKGLLRRINAERSVEDVWATVKACFMPSVVFVLGGPGSGKGTQCSRISDRYGYNHLSAGDLLREERSRPGSKHGELIESYIREGRLVPIEITLALLEAAMRKLGWEGGRFLIDGFPRSFENVRGWESALKDKVLVKCCLFFECSESVMEARLLERGKTSGRADDNISSIRKRFHTFQEESMPVVAKYESEGLLRRINAELPVEEVWQKVCKVFDTDVRSQSKMQRPDGTHQGSKEEASASAYAGIKAAQSRHKNHGLAGTEKDSLTWQSTYKHHFQAPQHKRFQVIQESRALQPKATPRSLQVAGGLLIGGGSPMAVQPPK
mmetsp:Transcript_35995/g.84363  ORF Transcript_35995/g.84363 Transcript_35995/m.84363 type:complete len:490 (-) Transcript_35995:182-1651(-)